MSRCFNCPRQCGVNRETEFGLCGAGAMPRVALAALHHWEEPVLSGTRGSGTVFFSGCNLGCVFCQNADISRAQKGSLCTTEQLAGLFVLLQEKGAHNINLVTPTPHIEALRAAIPLARKNGLSIPIVYNSGGYESVEALRTLRGLIDIYLPDFKYFSPARSKRYANAEDYFLHAAAAIDEMFKQVGMLQLDADGVAFRGLLIRHLVLPGNLDETRAIIAHLRAHVPPDTYLSLMGQYTPVGSNLPAPLHRPLTTREYESAVRACADAGFTNVFVQTAESAGIRFIPAFYENIF
ncbi:hypothetical protein LJC07_03360 [Christensenellaceae bacterium OttesenSCG-928-L17]|nr:hypothetical protein [Christensenellaceae bacterium OttesenSCG-928-L17]